MILRKVITVRETDIIRALWYDPEKGENSEGD